jgi:cell division transport system permease protein
MTVSVSSIFILVITLSIITSIYLSKDVFKKSIDNIKSKVDISIYMKPDTADAQMLAVKQKLQMLPEVKSVNFISREDTLNNFKRDNASDTATLQALTEVGSNPFGASFSVQADDTDKYSIIISKINDENLLGEDKSSIDKINYVDIKESIDKLNHLVSWFSAVGYTVTIVFVVMSLMIVYNTIRLAIFTFKEEISVMKLVGASNMYIRGPFIVESIIYGVMASIITTGLFYPITKYITSKTVDFFGGYSIHAYYMDNILNIAMMLAGAGVAVAAISSILAVRKYLSV